MSLFPITEFQFVFAGFATFAASVGYACARRRSSTSASYPEHEDDHSIVEDKGSPAHSDDSDSSWDSCDEPIVTEPHSLKRKSIDDHSSSGRPRKRSRSPSPTVELERHTTPPRSESPSADLPAFSVPTPPANTDLEAPQAQDVTMAATQEPETETNVAPVEVNQEQEPEPTPAATAVFEAPAIAPTPVVTPPCSPSPAPRARGFASFAGAGSPFASGASPFAASGSAFSPSSQRPAWCGNGNVFGMAQTSAISDSSEVPSALAPSPLARESTPTPIPQPVEVNALAAADTLVKDTVSHLTGEEDEDIESELKGVKLFIKRGSKGFTGGMPGHLKLLRNSKRAEERLLFRREPLWKVSMNVRVRPTVRCSFDEEDQVLRIVLKEAVEFGEGQELVVYALKRGRVSKKEFKEFADELTSNPLFKSESPLEAQSIASDV